MMFCVATIHSTKVQKNTKTCCALNTCFRNSLYSWFLCFSICCLRLKSLARGRPLWVSSGSFQLRFVAWAFLWCIDNKDNKTHKARQNVLTQKHKIETEKYLDSKDIHSHICQDNLYVKNVSLHAQAQWKQWH